MSKGICMQQVTLRELYDRMYEAMGPQGWWPAESKIEIILGAILVQNTNWKNVERSLANLRQETDFEPAKIIQLNQKQLIALITPSGFYQNKSKAILGIFRWLEPYDFNFQEVKRTFGKNLRKELLSLRGIGEETADALLLYVFDEKVFVADRYAQKLFTYLGVEKVTNYRLLKQKVPALSDFTLLQAQEFHGLIDEFGKRNLKNETAFLCSFLADTKLFIPIK